MTENSESERAVTDADQVFLRKCANQPSGLYQLISSAFAGLCSEPHATYSKYTHTPKIFRITRYILYNKNIFARISFQNRHFILVVIEPFLHQVRPPYLQSTYFSSFIPDDVYFGRPNCPVVQQCVKSNQSITHVRSFSPPKGRQLCCWLGASIVRGLACRFLFG